MSFDFSGLRATGGVTVAGKAHIHRYCSLYKFVSLVTTKRMFVPSIELLRRADPCEGIRVTARELARRGAAIETVAKLLESGGAKDKADEIRKKHEDTKKLDALGSLVTSTYFASSWFLGHHEDMLLWRTYAYEGVALATTVRCLRAGIRLSKQAPVVRRVKYGEKSWGTDPRAWVFHKRIGYRGESEVRAVFYPESSSDFDLNGVYADVDLGVLKLRVITSPFLPAQFTEDLKKLVQTLKLPIVVESPSVEA